VLFDGPQKKTAGEAGCNNSSSGAAHDLPTPTLSWWFQIGRQREKVVTVLTSSSSSRSWQQQWTTV